MWSLCLLVIVTLSKGLTGTQTRDYKTELREFNSSNRSPSYGQELQQETVYYAPVFVEHTALYVRPKRISDPTFRGKPKTRQEVWQRNFNSNTLISNFEQIRTLMLLLNSVILQYMNACTPVILYDNFVENQEGDLLKRLFQDFPTTYIHGKINHNYTLDHPELLNPPDSKCRSYILFLADALMTRRVIGSQIDNKVIVVPRSTQWKLQEFLSSPLSRDIINLLVIGESYSSDLTKIRPYVLYTHKLYTDGLGSNQPILLTSWMRDKFTRPHVNLFPTKFSSGFAGHRFSVVAANQPPYVFKRISVDGVGNINIKWDGLEIRVLRALAKMMNFTINIVEPKNLNLGSGDAVADMIVRKQGDIGLAGMYVTSERNYGMTMSMAHTTDCAAFISLTSKALPRFRAIMGPFQWPVWLCLTAIYLLAIFPLAFSDRLSLKHLIGNYTEIENMFWYVFGTFTNSLTFSGQYSWSTSKKNSTRLLIGWYWMFTIIITACYTGSIIAFVTIPVFPDTVDTVDQLLRGLFRIGTLDRGGWERWFVNSTHKSTEKLLKNLEYVVDVEEGLRNVTQAFFWSYAFIGSRRELEYIVQSNFSSEYVSKRSALHISNECLGFFGVSFGFPENSVYKNRFNDAILLFQQNGLIAKLLNEVSWEMQRSPTGSLLQATAGKSISLLSMDERGLALADTEGMFLLLGIGYLIAAGVLISEWVGGCTNKCKELIQEHKDSRRSRTSFMAVSRPPSSESSIDSSDELEMPMMEDGTELGKASHSRPSSTSLLSDISLQEMYDSTNHGIHSTIVMLNGKLMTDDETRQHVTNPFEENFDAIEVWEKS